MVDWAKYAARSQGNLVDLAKARRQAAAKAPKQPKVRYARVTEDMFPALTHMPGPSVGLVLLLLMRSGLTSTKRQEGWVSLPKVAFQQIGLGDRFKRKDASRRLVRVGVVETRRPGPGASLEYRLLPVEQWGQR